MSKLKLVGGRPITIDEAIVSAAGLECPSGCEWWWEV